MKQSKEVVFIDSVVYCDITWLLYITYNKTDLTALLGSRVGFSFVAHFILFAF